MNLLAYELEASDPIARHVAVGAMRTSSPPMLILNTCQRFECWGFGEPSAEGVTVKNQLASAQAFERLARIAAGLESRILGELEILGQVRTSYKQFREDGGDTHSKLDRIFQDALSLARKARRESEIDQNLTSLGALASRELMSRVSATAAVAVVGSGSVAASVARYLSKRGDYPVRVSSRCPENAMQLAMECGGFGTGLDQLSHLLDGVEGIVTATAAPHAVVYDHHLEGAKKPLTIIDLGVPADCAPAVQKMDGVTYIPLIEVEERAQLNSEERRQRAELAGQIIRDGARKWAARRISA
jgi:glutamyl-tRNA reductase